LVLSTNDGAGTQAKYPFAHVKVSAKGKPSLAQHGSVPVCPDND